MMRSFRPHRDPVQLMWRESCRLRRAAMAASLRNHRLPARHKARCHMEPEQCLFNCDAQLSLLQRDDLPNTPNANPRTLDQAKSYLVHRFLTRSLGEATRLAELQPRWCVSARPVCLFRTPGRFADLLQPHYAHLGARIGREHTARLLTMNAATGRQH